MASFVPKTAIINSIRNQNLQWHIVLAELIDNAFDAGATRVSINFDVKTLTVVDDGSGCKDLISMITLGDHNPQAGTKLGRYGVGAKDAFIICADGVIISSVHHGVKRMLTCNWKQAIKNDNWETDDPTETPVSDAPGTEIRMFPLIKSKPTNAESLIKRLSRIYTPAIRSGRQIVLRFGQKKEAIAVPEYRLPPLDRQMSADINVFGKQARVTMGMVPDGHVVDIGGISVSYGYRVIMEGQRIGLGDDPTPNLVGWVELGEGWMLAKNKDNVTENLEPLGQAIYAACREVIDLAASKAANVLFDDIGRNVSDAIGSVFTEIGTAKKEKRRATREVEGTVEPKDTGRRRRKATLTQPGVGLTIPHAGEKTAMRVGFRHLGEAGPVSQQEGNVIYLNRDIPLVAERMNDPESLAIHAVYAASAYLAIDKQLQIPGWEDADKTSQKIASWAGVLLSRMNRPSANAESIA